MITARELGELRAAIVTNDRIAVQAIAAVDIMSERLKRIEEHQRDTDALLLQALELFVATQP